MKEKSKGKHESTRTLKACDVPMPLWKWDGIVLVGGQSADFTAWAKRSLAVDIETRDHAAGHAHVEMGKPWLIWLEALANVPTLAHEALHVTAGVLEARGLKHHESSEEAYTYTMEHIMRTVLDAKKWRVCR